MSAIKLLYTVVENGEKIHESEITYTLAQLMFTTTPWQFYPTIMEWKRVTEDNVYIISIVEKES